MDTSGLGFTLISCCITVFIPPIISAAIWGVIYADFKGAKEEIGRRRGLIIFLVIYILTLIASCLFDYFFIMKDLYVM